MRALLSVGLVLATTVSARCENNVVGYGINSCATFGQGYKKHPEIAEELYFGWAQGFMSGLNIGAHATGHRSKDVTASSDDAQKRSIRDRCNEHPLGSYYDAVLELMKSFPSMNDN
jgi:hypothetical protein